MMINSGMVMIIGIVNTIADHEMDEQAIIEAMRSGATLYQEGNNTWYLAGVGYPRKSVDAAICERLDRRNVITEAGDDESPAYERGWQRWYILS
jgi:hypothetical protein